MPGPALGGTTDLVGSPGAPAADASAVTESVPSAPAPHIQAPEVPPAPQVQTPQVPPAPQVQTPQVQTPQAPPAQIQTPQVPPAPIQPAPIQPPPVPAPSQISTPTVSVPAVASTPSVPSVGAALPSVPDASAVAATVTAAAGAVTSNSAPAIDAGAAAVSEAVASTVAPTQDAVQATVAQTIDAGAAAVSEAVAPTVAPIQDPVWAATVTQTGRRVELAGPAFRGGGGPPAGGPPASSTERARVARTPAGAGAVPTATPTTRPVLTPPEVSVPDATGTVAQAPSAPPSAMVISTPAPREREVPVLAARESFTMLPAVADTSALEAASLRAPAGPSATPRTQPDGRGASPEGPQLPSPLSALGAAASSAAGSGLEIPAALLVALLLVAPRLGRRLRPTPDLWRPPLYVSALERPG